MATAEELLALTSETTEEILVADLVNRTIVIPTTLRILGVESDDDVKRLHFNIPRYYGEVDLSEFKIQINFENAKGEGDFWPVDDLVVNEDNTLTFSWLVDRSAFMYAGNVTFNLCMKKYDTNGIVIRELNTTTASLPVLKGLETSKEIVESNPSAFDAVLFRLSVIEEKVNNSGWNVDLTGYATEQWVKDQNYLMEHQDISGKLDKEDYIDWFAEGVSIPKNSDLNTYKTNGKFYANSESTAQTLLNRPDGMNTNFCMFVFDRTDGVKSQLMITLAGKMYIRSTSSTTWRAWVAYTTSDEIATLMATIRQEITDELSKSIEGEPGGYYTPSVSQEDTNTVKISFTASKESMSAVADKTITLPAGPHGPEGEKGESGESGVYTLAEGETIADAPEWAAVVVDPYSDPAAVEMVATLDDGSKVTYKLCGEAVTG